MRVAVVGHVEWVDFVRVERLPSAGDITHAQEAWAEPAGGGAVSACVLAALAGECSFLTALGDDELGRRSQDELARLGVRVEAAFRPEPQRRAVTFVDATGERTITLLSHKLVPRRDDDLPWEELADGDAVYFTGGDAEALRAARTARVLVATARELPTLRGRGRARRARAQRRRSRRALRAGQPRSTSAPGGVDRRRRRRCVQRVGGRRARVRGCRNPGPDPGCVRLRRLVRRGAYLRARQRLARRRRTRARSPLRGARADAARRLRRFPQSLTRLLLGGAFVLRRGGKWATVAQSGGQWMAQDDASRRIRAHGRRQGADHASVPFPRGLQGRNRPDAGDGPVLVRLYPRRVDGPRPVAARVVEPAEPRQPEDSKVLLFRRVGDRAGQAGQSDAAARARAARAAQARRRRGGSQRPPRDLGPLHLAGAAERDRGEC